MGAGNLVAQLHAASPAWKPGPLHLVLGTFALYLAVTRTAAWLRLRHIPGPFECGWNKWWLIRHQFAGKLPLDLDVVCSVYGPLVRIAPNWLVCSDPAEIRRLWNIRSGYSRSSWYHGLRFDPANDSIITATDNKHHARLRAAVLPGYQGRGLEQDQEDLVDAQLIKFLELVRRKYVSDPGTLRPLDMSNAMQFLTQDIISAIEFGSPFGYLDTNSDRWGIIAVFEALLRTVMCMALFPIAKTILSSRAVRPFLPKPTDPAGPGRLLGLVKAHVDDRFDDDAAGRKAVRRNDVLQRFVDSALTREELQSEALIHMVGGTDTTALALRNALFFVSSSPPTYRALQAEIDAVVAADRLEHDGIVRDARVREMPYLQAVIKEALRLWPPVMGLMARASDKVDVVCGYKVPGGTHIAWAGWAVMRHKGVFGEDAEAFRPERWLEADMERRREMEAVQGLVFAGGTRWECLGRRLAALELGKALFELFRRFDFAMLDPIQPFTWVSFGTTVHTGMKVRVTTRLET